MKYLSVFVLATALSTHAEADKKSASECWGAVCLNLTGETGDILGAGNMLPEVPFEGSNAVVDNTTKDGFKSAAAVTNLAEEKIKTLGKVTTASEGKNFMFLSVSAHSGHYQKEGFRFSLPSDVVHNGQKKPRALSYDLGRGSYQPKTLLGADGKPVLTTNGDKRPILLDDDRHPDIASQRISVANLSKALDKNIQGLVCIMDGCYAGAMKDAIQRDPRLKDMPLILIGSASATEQSAGGVPAVYDKNGTLVTPAQGFLSGYSAEVSHNLNKYDTDKNGSVDLKEFIAGMPPSLSAKTYNPATKKLEPFRSETGQPLDMTQHPFSYEQGNPDIVEAMKELKIFEEGQEIWELTSEDGSLENAQFRKGHTR